MHPSSPIHPTTHTHTHLPIPNTPYPSKHPINRPHPTTASTTAPRHSILAYLTLQQYYSSRRSSPPSIACLHHATLSLPSPTLPLTSHQAVSPSLRSPSLDFPSRALTTIIFSIYKSPSILILFRHTFSLPFLLFSLHLLPNSSCLPLFTSHLVFTSTSQPKYSY